MGTSTWQGVTLLDVLAEGSAAPPLWPRAPVAPVAPASNGAPARAASSLASPARHRLRFQRANSDSHLLSQPQGKARVILYYTRKFCVGLSPIGTA